MRLTSLAVLFCGSTYAACTVTPSTLTLQTGEIMATAKPGGRVELIRRFDHASGAMSFREFLKAEPVARFDEKRRWADRLPPLLRPVTHYEVMTNHRYFVPR